VGLIERGQPELVVLGLDPMSAHEGITWVADRAKKGFSVPVNMRDPLDDFDLKLVDVPFDWLATDPSRMAMWFNHYDSGPFGSIAPDVRQLVWADDKGVFPDDPVCDPEVVARQPLLAVDPFTYPQPARPRRNAARHQKQQG
jgi:hypothetical protein